MNIQWQVLDDDDRWFMVWAPLLGEFSVSLTRGEIVISALNYREALPRRLLKADESTKRAYVANKAAKEIAKIGRQFAEVAKELKS